MAESGASAAPRSYTLRLPGSSWSAARSEGGRWYFYVPRAGAPPTWSPPDGLDYTNAELDAAWLRENPSVSAMPLISSADALKDDQRRLDARHWMKSLCPSLTTLTPLHKPVETALLGYGSPTHPTNIPNYGSTLAVRRTLSAAYAMTAPRALADDASARVSWERLTTEARRTNALTNPTFKQMAAAAPDALRTDASAQLVLAELLVGTYVPMGLTVNLLATLLDAYRPPAPVGASASTSSSDAAPLAARGTGGGAAEDSASASAGGSSSPSASAGDGARVLGGQEAAMQVMVQMFREKYRAEVGASLLASAREQEGSEWLARVIPDVLTVAEWRSVMISLSDASPDDRFLTSIVQAMESGMYWDDALKARVMAGSLTSLRHVLMQAVAARGLLTPAPLKSLPQPAALYWRSLGADAEALSHAAHHGLISNVVLERLIKDTVSAAREGELPPPYLLRSLRMATLRQAIGMKLVQGGASSAVACSVVPLERALVDVYAAEPSHDEALPFVSITQHLATLRRVASKHAAALWRDFAPGEQFVQTLLEQAALRTAPPLPYSAALPEEGGTALAAARRAHALCVAPLPALDVQEFMGALLSCVECMLERNAWAAVIAEKEKLGNGGAPSDAADADAAGEDGEAAAAAQQAQRAYIDQLLAAASAVASTASQPDVLAFLSYLLFNPEVSIDARLAPPDAFVQLGLKVPRLAAPLDCLAFTFSWLCWAAAAGGHPMGPPPHGVSNLSSHAMPGHALFVPPADVACAWVPASPDGETTDVDAAWMTTLKAAVTQTVKLIKDGGPLTDITSLIRSDFAVVARSEKAKVHALAEVTTCAAAFQPLGVGVLHWLRHTLLRPTSADDRTKIAVSGLVARTALVLARGNAFFQPAALLLLRNLYYYIGAPTAPGTRTQWSQNQETLVQTFVQLAGMGFTVPVLKFVRAHAAEWELAHLRAFMTTLVAAMSPPLSFDAAFEFTALVSAMQRRIIAENAARAGLGDTSAALLRIADEGSAKLKELLGHAFRPHCIIPPPQHIATTEAQAQLCALVRRIEEDAKKHNVL